MEVLLAVLAIDPNCTLRAGSGANFAVTVRVWLVIRHFFYPKVFAGCRKSQFDLDLKIGKIVGWI